MKNAMNPGYRRVEGNSHDAIVMEHIARTEPMIMTHRQQTCLHCPSRGLGGRTNKEQGSDLEMCQVCSMPVCNECKSAFTDCPLA